MSKTQSVPMISTDAERLGMLMNVQFLINREDILCGKVKYCKIDDISAQYSLAIALMCDLNNMSKDQEISSDDWHNMFGNFIEFIMNNMKPEIVVMSMRTALAVMRLSFDRSKIAIVFTKFYDGYSGMIFKSLNI